MTTKEISELCEVSTRTVRRWVDKMSGGVGHNDVSTITAEKIKMLEAGEAGKAVDWTEEEVFQILQSGGRGAIAQWMKQNKSQTSSFCGSGQPDIAAIVRETMTAMVPALIAIVRGALPEQKALALPTVPELAPRDSLRRIVAKYSRQSGDFPGAWNNLYSEFSYRYHVNLKERAKNRGMEILDYAEADGFIDDLLALAVVLYGAAA